MNDNAELAYIRCIIYGRVQGVFFRVSARNQAEQLGIMGYAKNLPDRTVEVVACGTSASLENFKTWLHQGPTSAQVTKVECEPIPEQHFSNFIIL